MGNGFTLYGPKKIAPLLRFHPCSRGASDSLTCFAYALSRLPTRRSPCRSQAWPVRLSLHLIPALEIRSQAYHQIHFSSHLKLLVNIGDVGAHGIDANV